MATRSPSFYSYEDNSSVTVLLLRLYEKIPAGKGEATWRTADGEALKASAPEAGPSRSCLFWASSVMPAALPNRSLFSLTVKARGL